MFDSTDYIFCHREREQGAYDERMEAFAAGRCSLHAAIAGGAEYERDLAETALELKEAGCKIAEPIAAAPAARTRARREERSAA